MSTKKRLFAFVAVLFGGLCSAVALPAVRPVLTNAVWSGGQFQFTVLGETNVPYIILSSSDLNRWTFAITNSAPEATRTVTVPASSAHTFWRVRPAFGPLFEHAILARAGVALGGNGRIDSFNSTNIAESTTGMYDPSKATDRATVATTLVTGTAISAGNMSVYGSLMTGPGALVTVGPNGSVGSAAFNNNPLNAGTIEPGHWHNDYRAFFSPAFLPVDFVSIPNALPGNTTVGGTNYTFAVLSDGDYQRNGHLSIGSGAKMLINARCRIFVIGDTTVQSTGHILMGPDASVEWYCIGRVNLQGQGIINQGGFARNLAIVALSSQPVNYAGQAGLIGRIYAPLSQVSLSGTVDAIGSIVCSNFTLSGSMGLHFDESLKSVGPFF